MNEEPSPYYFDTNALWKFYRDEPGSMNVRRLAAKETILISPLTTLEFAGALMKYCRKGELKKSRARKIFSRIRRDTGFRRRPFRMIRFKETCFREAELILLEHAGKFAVNSYDALHIAIARKTEESAIVVTSESSIHSILERLNMEYYDPEKA